MLANPLFRQSTYFFEGFIVGWIFNPALFIKKEQRQDQ